MELGVRAPLRIAYRVPKTWATDEGEGHLETVGQYVCNVILEERGITLMVIFFHLKNTS